LIWDEKLISVLHTNSSLHLQKNPEYTSTFVFTNDFSALIPDAPDPGTMLPRDTHSCSVS